MHQTDGLTDDTGARLGTKLLMTLGLGLLLATSVRCLLATHERRTCARPKKLPRRLQTWEGEGGRPSDTDDHEPELHPEPLPHVGGQDRQR